MIIVTQPHRDFRTHKLYRFTFNLPYIAQYQGYERSWNFTCPECGCDFNHADESTGIVGWSEDNEGGLLLLRECPKCGKKWYSHTASDETSMEDFKQGAERILLDSYDYHVMNENLLVKKEEIKI